MFPSFLGVWPRGRVLYFVIVLCSLAVPTQADAQAVAAGTALSGARLASLASAMPRSTPGPARLETGAASQGIDLSSARPVFGEPVPTAEPVGAAPETLAQQPVAAVTPLGNPRSPGAPSSPGSTALLRGLYVSFSALQMFDAASTMTALDHGAVEANPLMTGIASRPVALIAVKAATAASTIFLVERIARKSRWGAIATMIALNSVYAMVVTHNYRVADAMAAR